MAGARTWVAGCRPRTARATVVAVAVGCPLHCEFTADQVEEELAGWAEGAGRGATRLATCRTGGLRATGLATFFFFGFG